ncbi:MAG: hypothetical protein HFI30_02060 [Lachnospiraceae bacterium]|nr:hypothetical protein [Lachnospiraceae bacterium]
MAKPGGKWDRRKNTIDDLADIVKKYYVTSEEERANRRNTGLLKFLKYMRVSSLVVSPNPDPHVRRERFLRDFKALFKQMDSDLLFSLTDPERNLREYLDSSLWELLAGGGEELKAVEPETSAGVLIPFLLLQELEKETARCLKAYLMPDNNPYGKSDGNSPEKENKYVELVFSLAYYEIFLEEFLERFVDDIKRSREGDASSAAEERLTLLEKELRECEDREEKQALAVKLQEAMKETMSFLQRAQMAVLYLNLYAYHDVNLIALLRMLVIMEYVNINHAPSISAGKGDKERRRARIKNLVDNELREFPLFYYHYRVNRNLSRLFDEVTVFAEKRNMIPDPENREEMEAFKKELDTYIELNCGQMKKKRTVDEERKLWESRLALARPFLWDS